MVTAVKELGRLLRNGPAVPVLPLLLLLLLLVEPAALPELKLLTGTAAVEAAEINAAEVEAAAPCEDLLDVGAAAVSAGAVAVGGGSSSCCCCGCCVNCCEGGRPRKLCNCPT